MRTSHGLYARIYGNSFLSSFLPCVVRSSVVVSTSKHSVHVPVGKPSIMPVQAKKAICQQTIYTSPIHAREEPLSPRPLPVAQRAPPPPILYRPGRTYSLFTSNI